MPGLSKVSRCAGAVIVLSLAVVIAPVAVPDSLDSRPRGIGRVPMLLPLAAFASDEPTATGLPFDFTRFAFSIRPLNQAELPFAETTAPRVDAGLHDAEGVRMWSRDGGVYNHVSAQATYGVHNLNSYRQTREALYLERARAQATRLIERRVEVGDAWYHPYDFPWGGVDGPWYSALGQGYALVLFSRLYEVTGEVQYGVAAQKTFLSYLDPVREDGPWVTAVDPGGQLWLHEYPEPTPDYTYNGHMVAAFGLYDYYRTSGDPRALELFRGAATTAIAVAPAFRQFEGRSLYCLTHRLVATPAYHEVIVQFYLRFFRMTGDTRFARLADAYEYDFPRYQVTGRISVRAGTYEMASWDPTRTRTFRPTASTTLPVKYRRRIPGRAGYWFQVSSGEWAGYWIKERSPYVYHPLQLVRLDYAPARSVDVPRTGTYTLRKYSPTGAVTAAAYWRLPPSAAYPRPARAFIRASAVIRGRKCYLLATGTYAGYWIDASGLKVY